MIQHTVAFRLSDSADSKAFWAGMTKPYLQNRTVDWLDHQLAARELLDMDFAATPLIVEHEYTPARVQDKDLLRPVLAGSVSFTRNIDKAAADMYALQHEVLASQGIPIQGVGRQAYQS